LLLRFEEGGWALSELDVLLPVKDGADYLHSALESILAQSFGSFTVLVVDDHSSDDTPALVAEFAKRDSRVKLITSNGCGLVDALNQGLSLSTSPFIARMDADDIAMPMRFERQLFYLKAHPSVDVVGSWVQPIDSEGNDVGSRQEYPVSPKRLKQILFSGRNPLAHPTVMMRRGTIERIGGYRRLMTSAEDLDLWLRIAEAGELANVPEVLLKYRVHPSQVSSNRYLDQGLASELAFICSAERLAGRGDPAENVANPHEIENFNDVPSLIALYSRFKSMSAILQDRCDQEDLFHTALAHIASSDEAMSINHRLYADISARIFMNSVRRGSVSLALKSILVGMQRDTKRFFKTVLSYNYHK
jgi:glycosyltransferase involved in cell wall biosynthesis